MKNVKLIIQQVKIKIMEKTQEELDLEKELDLAGDESQEAFDKCPAGLNFDEFEEYMRPYDTKVREISRKLRMIKTPEFSDLPDFGDVMSLKKFISNVECGGFIDYDGYGSYVKDGKESNITIYPSDVKHGAIRKDFDTIIWYNR